MILRVVWWWCVCCCCCCSGPLRTELLMKFLNTDAKKQRRLVHVPMGRFGEVCVRARRVA